MITQDIFTRAQAFYSLLCQDPEMHAQHMDGLHFLTESLFKLWQLIDNDHKPSARNPALRALYATKDQAVAYENIMKDQVFDPVSNDYILIIF